MHLLTTHTHDSERQAITAPPLRSTIHKSPQHPLSLFQSAVSSPAVPWQRLLRVEILQLHTLNSSLQRHPYIVDLIAPVVFQLLGMDHAETPPFQQYLHCCVRFADEGTCLQSRCPETTLVYPPQLVIVA
jgi:hypothetical protein